MAFRLPLKLVLLSLGLLVLFVLYFTTNSRISQSSFHNGSLTSTKHIAVISRVVQELKKLKFENVKVNSKNKTCQASFPSSLAESLNFLLRMKTDEATEKSLHQLGLPNRSPSIHQLVLPKHVQTNEHDKIPTIVCGASSNHFGELQALFYHIDTKIRLYFPDIKVVFYDIGLGKSEIKRILNYGRVEYRKLNFDLYPPHIKILQLCAWKPIIIQEVLREVGNVMYLDASVRPRADYLQRYFNISEKKGHVFRSISRVNTIVSHTYKKTFSFFNVLPCLYHGLPEIEGGYMIVRSDSLSSLLIMRSYVACALQEQCIMPPGTKGRTSCNGRKTYHLCHRNDQSVLGITVFIIYHNFYNIPVFKLDSFSTKRGQRSDYLMKMVDKTQTLSPKKINN